VRAYFDRINGRHALIRVKENGAAERTRGASALEPASLTQSRIETRAALKLTRLDTTIFPAR
jgi:hypothetical protein